MTKLQINEFHLDIINVLEQFEQAQPGQSVSISQIIDQLCTNEPKVDSFKKKVSRGLRDIKNNQKSRLFSAYLRHHELESKTENNKLVYSLKTKSSINPEEEALHRNIISRLGKEIVEKFLPSATKAHANAEEFEDHSYELDDDQKLQMKRFLTSLGIVHRGMVLRPQSTSNTQHLDRIYDAIKNKKQVSIALKQLPLDGSQLDESQAKAFSLLGVVYRDPKFFIIVQDQEEKIHKFITSDILDLKILEQTESIRRDDFDINKYIQDHMMDRIHPDIAKRMSTITADVRLQLHPEGDGSNFEFMRKDLEEYRLSNQQVGPKKIDDQWFIDLPNQRLSLQLIEYLAGRWESVEVLEPAILRDLIKTKLNKTLARYNSEASAKTCDIV